MSFVYRNKTVTFDNYKKVFEQYSPDVLDEIRSAILDSTPIMPFIEPCAKDDEKLKQLRLALREMIPLQYLSAQMTANTIRMIRRAFATGLDLSDILPYISGKSLLVEPDTFEKLVQIPFTGNHIDKKLDFTRVPKSLVDIFVKGQIKGYPMWLLLPDDTVIVSKLTEERVEALMRGMYLNIDIHPFLDTDWNIKSLYLLFSYGSSCDLDRILTLVSPKFSCEQLDCLLKLEKEGIPVARLCVKDDDGYPLFNEFQMESLGTAMRQHVLTDEMLNWKLSDFEIDNLVKEELQKTS